MKSYETIKLPTLEDINSKGSQTVKLPVVIDRDFKDTSEAKQFLDSFNETLINQNRHSISQQEFNDLNNAYKYSKTLPAAERITIQRRLKEISRTIHSKPEESTN